MRELQNEFSWSKSRHEKLKECPRAYFYHYYGSWGGWQAAASSPSRELYVLKKLSSRWQWAGSLVHDALKQMLTRAKATGQFAELADLVRRTRERARAQWSVSREKAYWREASKIVGLVEHEYGEPVDNAEWKRIYDEVIEGSLAGFYASEVFKKIKETPREKWLTVDVLDSWEFEGTKIWVAIDFAYRDEQGATHILDWKTGKERGVDHTQVGLYALYAQKKWGIGVDEVVGGLVYLGAEGGKRVDVKADPASLDTCAAEMRASIAQMRAALDDAAANRASIASFPQIEDREACRRCPFRRPCGRL